MISQFPKQEPILREGEVVWYQQATKDEASFFSQASIRDVFVEGGSWRYYYDKTVTISSSANGVFRKDGATNCSIRVEFIDRKICTFADIQAIAHEHCGAILTPESIYLLPHKRAKPNHKGEKIKKAYAKTASVVPPDIEELTQFCKDQQGSLRQRLIATANHFNKPPSLIASKLQHRLNTVIPIKLIEHLELLEA